MLGSKILAASAMAAALAVTPAMGADDTDIITTPSCPRGQVWDQGSGKCVVKSSNLVDDADRLAYGATMARADKFAEAISVLSEADDLNNDAILTFLGFAHRKAGRIEVGFGYYRQALAINPDNVLAREYLGEAFLTVDDLASAKAELAAIEARCGTDCEAYEDLAADIAAYEAE